MMDCSRIEFLDAVDAHHWDLVINEQLIYPKEPNHVVTQEDPPGCYE